MPPGDAQIAPRGFFDSCREEYTRYMEKLGGGNADNEDSITPVEQTGAEIDTSESDNNVVDMGEFIANHHGLGSEHPRLTQALFRYRINKARTRNEKAKDWL